MKLAIYFVARAPELFAFWQLSVGLFIFICGASSFIFELYLSSRFHYLCTKAQELNMKIELYREWNEELKRDCAPLDTRQAVVKKIERTALDLQTVTRNLERLYERARKK